MNKALLLLAALTSTDGNLERLSKTAQPYDHQPVYQQMHAMNGRFDMKMAGLFHVRTENGPFALRPGTTTHEFPWVHTAGYTQPVHHAVYIPEGKKILYRDTYGPRVGEHGDLERVIDWQYPVGTVFVEVLTTHELPFEVRTRTKTAGMWRSTVYRPYADADDLIDKLNHLGTRDAKTLANQIQSLPRTGVSLQNRHDHKTFRFQGYREDLPEIPEALSRAILGWRFVPHSGWKSDSHAPSTRSDRLSIVSKDYEGYMVKGDSKGCMQCHESVGRHAFQLQRNRDWYGRVRGSDGIFSFHIFDETSISPQMGQGREPKLNGSLPLQWTETFPVLRVD
jgi:hypothetical protein